MISTAPGNVRQLRADGRAEEARRTFWRTWAGVGVTILAAIGVATAHVAAGSRAVRAIPEEQRVAIASRTLEELKQFCGEGRPAALTDHCRELASFLRALPDCRGECEDVVRRQLAPNPTR